MNTQLTEAFLREQYCGLGKSTEQIGREVGCSGRNVRYYMKKFGIEMSEQMREKVRSNATAAGMATRFKAGESSPQKGHTKETHPSVARSAAAKVGRKRPDLTGSLHPNWKDGATAEAMLIRNGSEYKAWRSAVYTRDNFTCQDCGNKGRPLNAHHVKSFADNPDLRFDVENGVTLCLPCHWRRHPDNPYLKGRAKTEEHRLSLSEAQKKRFARERALREAEEKGAPDSGHPEDKPTE